MRTTSQTTALLAAALMLAAASAGAAVKVAFVEPEKYADVAFDTHDKQRIMNELQRHFEKLGATLPAGQDLKIDVLDIDLAGRIEPSARASRELRILRGRADWPIISLRYELQSEGRTLKSGEERIADMSYMQGFNHYSASESLRYEKQMLDRWFDKTFSPPKAAKKQKQ